jgi:hypothetical protein
MTGPKPQSRHILMSSMKDEGPFILEWVAHHLVLGFDRICVASNDCRDGSDRLLAALAAAGYIDHVPNLVPEGQIPQHSGYNTLREKARIDDTEWLMVLDADEFLSVQIGGNKVGDLTGFAGADCDIISLHAMCFADAPQVNWQPGPVCALFPWRIKLTHKANQALKSLTRAPGRFGGIHNHSMVAFQGRPQDLRVMSGDGARFNIERGIPLWKQLRNAPVRAGAHKLAHYNHYAVKTWDSFNLRRERGRGAVAVTDETTARHTDAYFRDRTTPDAQDLTIARYAPEVADLMEKMLTDPLIMQCHNDCNAIYGALTAPFRRD